MKYSSLKEVVDLVMLRDIQVEALEETKKAIMEDGKTCIMLDLPTGSGKSIVCLQICDYYKKNINGKAKVDLLTCSKMLQTQYFEEFDFINNLWGKANYRCDKFNCDCELGKDMCDMNKVKCEDCPYDTAMKNWKSGDISLTNFHLFDMYSIFVPAILDQRQANLLIIDEAHNFEELFSDFISVSVSYRYLKRFKLPAERLAFYERNLPDLDKIGPFIKMLTENISPDIRRVVTEMQEAIKTDATVVKDYLKLIRDGNGFLDKIQYFVEQYEADPDNWVLEQQYNSHNEISIIAEPVWSAEYLRQLVWSKYKHVILMSGTMLDKKMFSKLMGVDVEKTHWISIPSPFPVENRQIYYMPIGKMTKDNKTIAFQDMVPYIKKVLKKYKDHKGIIHTNTYELSNWIRDEIKDDRLIFHTSQNRDEALFMHQKSKKPTILVSPSMNTGIDLKDDLSRFQIIIKMPYPSLGSKKVKRRLELNPDWYNWKTVADLVQTYGRSIRSETDWAETFIMDASFSTVRQRSIKFIPKYMLEAIVYMNVTT
jgi:ATP-dependent DNA helicase DinG